jgi:hypothetical protein
VRDNKPSRKISFGDFFRCLQNFPRRSIHHDLSANPIENGTKRRQNNNFYQNKYGYQRNIIRFFRDKIVAQNGNLHNDCNQHEKGNNANPIDTG